MSAVYVVMKKGSMLPFQYVSHLRAVKLLDRTQPFLNEDGSLKFLIGSGYSDHMKSK
jgi:hypothetical protein